MISLKQGLIPPIQVYCDFSSDTVNYVSKHYKSASIHSCSVTFIYDSMMRKNSLENMTQVFKQHPVNNCGMDVT